MLRQLETMLKSRVAVSADELARACHTDADSVCRELEALEHRNYVTVLRPLGRAAARDVYYRWCRAEDPRFEWQRDLRRPTPMRTRDLRMASEAAAHARWPTSNASLTNP
jgi:hypothetical protein